MAAPRRSSLILLLGSLSALAVGADAYKTGDGTAYSGECNTSNAHAPAWQRLQRQRLQHRIRDHAC